MVPLHRKLHPGPMRLLVRHAEGGGCSPLSGAGYAQARQLVSRTGGLPILRILSSPAPACLHTVEPLAYALRIRIEPCRLLCPDADPLVLARYLRDADTENSVLCTHQELLLGLFTVYANAGPRFIGGIAPMPAGASWTLHSDGDGPPRVRFLRSDSRESPRHAAPEGVPGR
jgi:hypothetical protein